MEEMDVLAGLEILEKEASSKSQKRLEDRKTADRLKQLRRKCVELEKKKLRLQEKLENELEVESEEEKLTAVGSVVMSRLENRLTSYRLTGVSGRRLSETCILIRFDTSFEGRFLEPYFIEVVNTHGMGIRHHSIPAFISVEEFAEHHMSSNFRRFLCLISDHITAYVHRREDLKKAQALLQSRGYIRGEIDSTIAVDIVQFHTQKDTLSPASLQITLRFNNLLQLKPSSASITAIGSVTTVLDQISEWQELLVSDTPSETLAMLCPEREAEEESEREDQSLDSVHSIEANQ